MSQFPAPSQPGGGFFNPYRSKQPSPYEPNTAPFANEGESSSNTMKRYYNDYHAADREQVLGEMNKNVYAPSQAPSAPPADGTVLGNIGNGQPAQPQQQPQQGGIQPGQVGQYMPQGYDQNKWSGDRNTPKYAIGRILSKYPPTPAGLQAAKAEIEATGLATVGNKDTITLSNKSGYGGQNVDVGQNFSTGGTNWWWGADDLPGSNNGIAAPSNQPQPNPLQPQPGQGQPQPQPQQQPYTINPEIIQKIIQMISGEQGAGAMPGYFNQLRPQQPQYGQQMDISSFLGGYGPSSLGSIPQAY